MACEGGRSKIGEAGTRFQRRQDEAVRRSHAGRPAVKRRARPAASTRRCLEIEEREYKPEGWIST